MGQEIDQDGAIAVAPPLGPLVDAEDLEGVDVGYRGRPHQPEEGGRASRQRRRAASRAPACAAEGHADGLQGVDQPHGFAGIRSGEVRQGLGKDAACTSQIAAHELPDEQLHTDGERAPGEVCQPALVVAMHREGWCGTVGARGGRRDGRELDLHRVILHDDFREANPTGRWEEFSHQGLEFKGHHLLCYRATPRLRPISPKMTMSHKIMTRFVKDALILVANAPR
jgi:hypothetical protein